MKGLGSSVGWNPTQKLFAPSGSTRGGGGRGAGLAHIEFTDRAPLEVHRVQSQPDGFVLHFTKPLATKPLDEPTGTSVADYRIDRFGYHYWKTTQPGPRRASSLSTSTPRWSVSSSAAYEMRKCVSAELNTLPGMISRLCLIAAVTNSVPVPHGARGNK